MKGEGASPALVVRGKQRHCLLNFAVNTSDLHVLLSAPVRKVRASSSHVGGACRNHAQHGSPARRCRASAHEARKRSAVRLSF